MRHDDDTPSAGSSIPGVSFTWRALMDRDAGRPQHSGGGWFSIALAVALVLGLLYYVC